MVISGIIPSETLGLSLKTSHPQLIFGGYDTKIINDTKKIHSLDLLEDISYFTIKLGKIGINTTEDILNGTKNASDYIPVQISTSISATVVPQSTYNKYLYSII